MKKLAGAMWKCDCGHIEYGKYPPEECSKCWKINGFIEVPEEVAEEIKDNILNYKENGDEEENFDTDTLLDMDK